MQQWEDTLIFLSIIEVLSILGFNVGLEIVILFKKGFLKIFD